MIFGVDNNTVLIGINDSGLGVRQDHLICKRGECLCQILHIKFTVAIEVTGNDHSFSLLIHSDADAAGSGANGILILNAVLAGHGNDVLTGFQIGSIQNDGAIGFRGSQMLPFRDVSAGDIVHRAVVNIGTVIDHRLSGAGITVHILTSVVQSQLDFLALGYSGLIRLQVIEDAGRITEEAPAGKVAQRYNIAVVEENLIRGGAPAFGCQRILVVQVSVP